MATYEERLAKAQESIRAAELELAALGRSRTRVESNYSSQNKPIPRKTANHLSCRKQALDNHIQGWKDYIDRGCVSG